MTIFKEKKTYQQSFSTQLDILWFILFYAIYGRINLYILYLLTDFFLYLISCNFLLININFNKKT